MASMILTDAQATEEAKEWATAPEPYRPRYAVSEMYFDEAAMKALGLTEPPVAGTIVQFTGTATVTSSSVRTEGDGDVKVGMSLQPLDLTLSPPKRDARAQFPKSKMEA